MFQMTSRVAVVRKAVLRSALSLLNNQQGRFGYSILALPRLQPTRNILPPRLREGEEHVQPGEPLERDDDWFKPVGRGRETPRQRLTRKIAEGINIDPTKGTEHTVWVEPETFPGSMDPFAGNKEEGAEAAKRHTNRPD